jgi:hypothetical protein
LPAWVVDQILKGIDDSDAGFIELLMIDLLHIMIFLNYIFLLFMEPFGYGFYYFVEL